MLAASRCAPAPSVYPVLLAAPDSPFLRLRLGAIGEAIPLSSALLVSISVHSAVHIQDPNINTPTFLEQLLRNSNNATKGAGVFSFASTHGIRLLFEDADFRPFLENNPFELIVGIDAVTRPSALRLLDAYASSISTLRVRAFLHTKPRVLFHPKMCWFETRATARVLVGSGNLTYGGLLANWEAFATLPLRGRARQSFLQMWRTWSTANSPQFRSVTDPQALALAQQNETAPRVSPDATEVDAADQATTPQDLDPLVLVAEIPRGSTRWNQANFNLGTFRNFFQMTPGQLHRAVLYPVNASGAVGPPEIRPGVSVKSRNYRVELGQAAGIPYPASSRPIAVFVRLGTRRFRYRLFLPGDVDYSAIQTFLTGLQPHPAGVRRATVSLSVFVTQLPNVTL